MMDYCERLYDGFWAEPFNALTNTAFVIVALVLFRLMRKKRQSIPWDVYLLLSLIVCIGLGSFLWHTLSTQWSELTDKLPIFAFMFVYLQSYLAHIFCLSWFEISVWIFLFLLLNITVQKLLPTDFLNGSVMYLPALIALLLMTFVSILQRLEVTKIMLVVVGLFCISITFRSIDQILCDAFSIGTHFIWHLFNAAMLYFLMLVLMRSIEKGQETSIH